MWSLDGDRGLFAFVFFFRRRLVVGGRRRVGKFVVNQTVQGDDRTNQRRQVNWKKLTDRGHQRAYFLKNNDSLIRYHLKGRIITVAHFSTIFTGYDFLGFLR